MPGLNLLHLLLICAGAAHAHQEMILIFNEENQHVLTQLVLCWCHVMLGVGQHAGLKYGRKVGRRHAILVGLGREYGEEVEDVEKQLLV